MIVFIHKGSQSYLKAALAQARLSNPNAEIILITDSCKTLEGFLRDQKIVSAPIDTYGEGASNFSKIYRHHGSNPVSYELFCYQRWFILRDFLLSYNPFAPGVLLDSDVFLYTDVSKVHSNIPSQMTVCNTVGPQFTFYKSSKVIVEYCKFIESCFTDELYYSACNKFMSDNQNLGIPHMSDMVTLGVFSKLNNLFDTSNILNDIVFDENLSVTDGYLSNFIGKRVFFKNDVRYFKLINQFPVQAGGIHLQGSLKRLWPYYVDKRILFDFLDLKTVILFIFEFVKRYLKGLNK